MPLSQERRKIVPSIYEVPIDPDVENDAHAYALALIGHNKDVLEVGCSTGFFTKALVERGCNVVGMELDPEAAEMAERWAERVVVGNIDEGDVWNYVKDESFDVVVLGDVLEHLHDPLASLRQAVRKLKPTGFVVTSLPNVAHGDVRIELMRGRFRYREMGLLDRTHVRFFTLETIRELMSQAGLVVVDTKRVVVPLFQSELGVKRGDVSHKTLDELHADPEVESYQYVMRSVRDNGIQAVAAMATQVNELTDRVHRQRVRLAWTRGLEQQVRAQKEYIEALEGHASGLEHNIEVLNEALIARNAEYQAVLSMRTVQMTAPVRWMYNTITRKTKKTT
jgi:O-antigen biosynthesis protein